MTNFNIYVKAFTSAYIRESKNKRFLIPSCQRTDRVIPVEFSSKRYSFSVLIIRLVIEGEETGIFRR